MVTMTMSASSQVYHSLIKGGEVYLQLFIDFSTQQAVPVVAGHGPATGLGGEWTLRFLRVDQQPSSTSAVRRGEQQLCPRGGAECPSHDPVSFLSTKRHPLAPPGIDRAGWKTLFLHKLIRTFKKRVVEITLDPFIRCEHTPMPTHSYDPHPHMHGYPLQLEGTRCTSGTTLSSFHQSSHLQSCGLSCHLLFAGGT